MKFCIYFYLSNKCVYFCTEQDVKTIQDTHTKSLDIEKKKNAVSPISKFV